ncbi:MAG: hypothetical protein HND56_10010 [Pseudomonadota bacterium]|nr:hypothetical protein [Pseudomonadota bacterium]QKK06002.1 MAG: hypothetical protein HND56_10010 [Pseudomonadota bacterium]
MSNISEDVKVKIYNASKVLQRKAGTGKIDPKKLKEAEKIIEENTVNFVPMALDYLKELEKALRAAKDNNGESAEQHHKITLPIMHLKSTGTVFKYPLVSDLSDITLTFLETTKTLNDDVLAIVMAHEQLLHAILAEEMSGDGGTKGKAMKKEMASVCNRYLKKHSGSNA